MQRVWLNGRFKFHADRISQVKNDFLEVYERHALPLISEEIPFELLGKDVLFRTPAPPSSGVQGHGC